MPLHLPDAIRYDTFGKSLEDYLDHLYAIFRDDFYTNEVLFLGKKVLSHKDPIDAGRVFTFNHITRYDVLKPRVDFNRSKKIPWLSPILNGCPDPDVKAWSKKTKSGKRWVTRVKVWKENSQFLLILQPKGEVYFLITAYTIGGERNINRLNQEYVNSPDKLF